MSSPVGGKFDKAERRSLADWLILAIASGLFLGFIPPRTATFALPLGIPLAWLLYEGFGWVGYLPALIVLWLLGVPLCRRAAQLLEGEDPRAVTFDEYATLPLVYFLAPSLFDWKLLLAGFALQRFFDILKPLGIRRLEKLPGGVGIIADDILASLYALAVMHLLVVLEVL